MDIDQFFFETLTLRDGEKRPKMDMQFLNPDPGFDVPEIFETQRKLARVEGEAHVAVRGWCYGLRDGSPYTMDRCRRLGLAIVEVIHYLKRDDSTDRGRLRKAVEKLDAIERDCREKGNRLPYE